VERQTLRAFLTAFLGSLAGKVIATIFVAVCALLGFGPDWIGGLIVSTPPAILVLRIIFLVLGATVLSLSLYQSVAKRSGTDPTSSRERRSSSPTIFPPEPSSIPLYFSRFPQGSFVLSDDEGERSLNLPETTPEHVHLWVMPSTRASLSGKTAKEAIQRGGLIPMGADVAGTITERNLLGAFICVHDSHTITHLTQLYETGEMFGMDFSLVSKSKLLKNPHVSHGIIPIPRFEQAFTATLANYLAFIQHTLRLPPPLSVTAGISGIRGFRLELAPGRPHIGKALHRSIALPIQVNSFNQPSSFILRPFFNHVWEQFGEDRPQNDHPA
jgi:hypothetical protein